MRSSFQLWKRGKIFYYRLPGEKTFHSTGKTSKRQAMDAVYQLIHDGKMTETKLKNYVKSFFLWEQCGWIRRQHAKDRPFSRATAAMRRGHLENYILPKFGNIGLSELNPVSIEK